MIICYKIFYRLSICWLTEFINQTNIDYIVPFILIYFIFIDQIDQIWKLYNFLYLDNFINLKFEFYNTKYIFYKL